MPSMNDAELKKLHEYQMKILDEIVSFCEKNNIRYFLTGGSALGAVRPRGLYLGTMISISL